MNPKVLSIIKRGKYILVDTSNPNSPKIEYEISQEKNEMSSNLICACIEVISSIIVGIPKATRADIEKSKNALLSPIVKAIEGNIEAYILKNNIK